MATCKFTLLPCPYKCKDDKNEITHFMRKDQDKHLKNDCPNRDHECEYCGEKGTYAYIAQVHDELCLLKILPCPNKCTKTMPSQDIEKHMELECEYTVIACKFKNIGCTTEMKRGVMAAHEQNDKLHLSKALSAVVKLQDSNSQLKEELLELSHTLKYGESITFNVTGFQGKKDSGEIFFSPSFYTSPGGYHMAIRVYANGHGTGEGTHISIFVQIMKGKYDTQLSWPLVGKVTIMLLNQLEDDNHKKLMVALVTENNAMACGHTWGFPKFILHSELAHDPDKNTQYLKNDTLYFRVSVEDLDHKPWLECTTNLFPV